MRVLLQIPASDGLGVVKYTAVSQKNADFYMSLSGTRDSWYSGCSIVPVDDYERYGFRLDKVNGAVSDDGAENHTRASYIKMKQNAELVAEANSDTVGDLGEQIKQLKSKLDSMERESNKAPKQKAAEQRAATNKKQADLALTKK